MQSQIVKKKKKVQRAEGRRAEGCYSLHSEQPADLGKLLISNPPIGSVWQKPPAIALDTTAARGGK